MSDDKPPGWIESAHDDERIAHLESQLARARMQAREQKSRASRLEKRLIETEIARDNALGVMEHRPGEPLTGHDRTSSPDIVPCLLLSDLHLNQGVRLEDTNGRNEFNPEIAARRMKNLWHGFAWYVDGMARFQNVTGIWLCINGDVLDNELHISNIRTNTMTPMEGVEFAADQIIPGVQMLRREFPNLPIRIHMGRGNHERIDQRTPKTMDHENSIAWLVNTWIARFLQADEKISTHLARASTSYETILGHDFRIHHGDCFGYMGGVGGITVPARRWHMRANQTHPVHASLLGHWHQYRSETDIVINGSLIGPDGYSTFSELGAEAPCQAAFAVDEHRGMRFGVPIYVSEHGQPWDSGVA